MADALANIGEMINDRDLVMHTLGRLGDEYESFIQNITTWEVEVSYVKIQMMMCGIETRQKRVRRTLVLINPMAKVVTTKMALIFLGRTFDLRHAIYARERGIPRSIATIVSML